MNVNSIEISDLKQTVAELKIRLDSVCAQNERLSAENLKLKHENNTLKTDYNISSGIGIETRLRLHRLDSEREDLNSALQELRVKYEKLHNRYTTATRADHVNVSGQFYGKQKLIPLYPNDNKLESITENEIERSENIIQESQSHKDEMNVLKKKLEDAHEIIAGLDFELESVHFLETENEHLRNELKQLKNNRGPVQDVASFTTSSSTSSEEACYETVNELINGGNSNDDNATMNRHRSARVPHENRPSNYPFNSQDDATTKIETRVAGGRVKSIVKQRELLQAKLDSIYGGK